MAKKNVSKTDIVIATTPEAVEIVNTSQRSLEEITLDVKRSWKNVQSSGYEIGCYLNEAKPLFGKHGLWLKWLHSVGIEKRTAQRLMQIAQNYPNATIVSHLGDTKSLKLLKLPEDERNSFVEESHMTVAGVMKKVEKMTTREFEDAINTYLGLPTKSQNKDSEISIDLKVDKINKSLINVLQLINNCNDENERDRVIHFLRDICDDVILALDKIKAA